MNANQAIDHAIENGHRIERNPSEDTRRFRAYSVWNPGRDFVDCYRVPVGTEQDAKLSAITG